MRYGIMRLTVWRLTLLSQGLALFAILFGAVYVATIMSAAPLVNQEYEALETTVIYARGGEVLAGIYYEDRIYLSIDAIPEVVRNAFIAVEDRHFYSHAGVDPWGIARAAYANLTHGRIVEGGSTITQQLAQNLYLDRSQTVRRKLQEMAIALRLELKYSKNEILEMYLNHIYLGSGAYGVQAASHRYFDKGVDELTVGEAAVLAALPRAPSYYSPLKNLDAARARRNLVLQRMSQNGYLSTAEADEAAGRPLIVANPGDPDVAAAPYFVEHVRRKVLELFDHAAVYGGGLVIHTTLDVELQRSAEAALEEAVTDGTIPTHMTSTGNPVYGEQPQYAMVSLDVYSGAIRSMVGGRGGDEYNRAVQARRHPGSAFKPFIYAAAIATGDHPGTVVNDIPRITERSSDSLLVWPRNFDHVYRGLVTYRHALERSINTAAVEVIRHVGVEAARRHLLRYGFTSLTAQDGIPGHYALALGGIDRGVSPLEMAAAYGTFAAGGVVPRPYAIEKITDSRGRVLYRAPLTAETSAVARYFGHIKNGLAPSSASLLRHRHALTPAQAYIMTDMLRTVMERGTGRHAQLDVPAAGKTGTSDENLDAWFVGFTQGLVSSVWIGEDSPRPMRYSRTADGVARNTVDPDIELTGVHASQIWASYMRRVLDTEGYSADNPDPAFVRPEGVRSVLIDPITGRAPEPHTPRRIWEIELEAPPRITAASIGSRITSSRQTGSEPFWSPIRSAEYDWLTGLPVMPAAMMASLDSGFTPSETITFDFVRDSGIVLGPRTIQLGGPERLVTKDGKTFHGTYVVGPLQPVQLIDSEIGLPVDSERPVFETARDRLSRTLGHLTAP